CTTSSLRNASLPSEFARVDGSATPAGVVAGVVAVVPTPCVESILTVRSFFCFSSGVLQGRQLVELFDISQPFGVQVAAPCPLAQSLHHLDVPSGHMQHACCLVGERTLLIVLLATGGRVFLLFANPIPVPDDRANVGRAGHRGAEILRGTMALRVRIRD